jgi:hypothetical protein
MKMLNFKVTYRPFTTSDMTSELVVPALDEDDAKRIFEQMYMHNGYLVVEIEKMLI